MGNSPPTRYEDSACSATMLWTDDLAVRRPATASAPLPGSSRTPKSDRVTLPGGGVRVAAIGAALVVLAGPAAMVLVARQRWARRASTGV